MKNTKSKFSITSTVISLILMLVMIFIIQRTGSAQWVLQTLPVNGGMIPGISFIDSQRGAIGGHFVTPEPGGGKCYYTTNSGSQWIASSRPDSLRSILAIKFLEGTTGIAVGAYNELKLPDKIPDKKKEVFPNYKGIILRTTNGGASWSTANSIPADYATIIGTDFLDENTGYICGDNQIINSHSPKISKTTDGGNTWQEMKIENTNGSLRRIICQDEYVYSVGVLGDGFISMDSVSDGILSMSTNSGASWTNTIFPELHHISDIRFSNKTIGYLCGVDDPENLQKPYSSSIYKTTNSGLNWNKLCTFDSTFADGMGSFQNSGSVLIYGTKMTYFKGYLIFINAFINRSSDFGNSWIKSSVLNEGRLMNCTFLSSVDIYVSGGIPRNSFPYVFIDPVILHTTNGGSVFINQVNSSATDKSKLFQNFPNPFNPKTTISFSLNKAGTIKLSVYDIEGKEIYVLVQGNSSEGIHNIEFDGSSLSAGVYFYKLESENVSDVRKMIVLN